MGEGVTGEGERKTGEGETGEGEGKETERETGEGERWVVVVREG